MKMTDLSAIHARNPRQRSRWFDCLVVGLTLVVLPHAGRAAERPAGQSKPNFVIVLCDDLGYGDLACFGHPRIQTPHLDRLAGEGMKLTSCYAAAPVCSPSRAGILTGRTPYRCGVYDWIPENSPMHLRRSEITVAQVLKQAGYATCHVAPLYWQYDLAQGGPSVAIRDGVRKLLATAGFATFELYDLSSDPNETSNLAAVQPERVKSLAATMRKR